MVLAALSRLARIRVTLGYTALLAAVATVLFLLGPHVRDKVIRLASTNLHNLSDGRIGTLLGSAFVTEPGPVYIWLPGLVALLSLAELIWRSGRLVVAFLVGHIGATLLVAAGLAAALGAGFLSHSVRYLSDVGMSYGAVAVLGTLTPAIPVRLRGAWIGWWLAVAVGAAVFSGGDFTNIGHAVALVLGMGVGTRFGRPSRWTPGRYFLLAVAAVFCYLIFVGTDPVIVPTMGLGVLAAVLASRITRRRLVNRTLALAAGP